MIGVSALSDSERKKYTHSSSAIGASWTWAMGFATWSRAVMCVALRGGNNMETGVLMGELELSVNI